MMRVAIVGGGAAGVLAAVHLRRGKPDAQITLIDASGRHGTGAAYGTNDPTHLLNVSCAAHVRMAKRSRSLLPLARRTSRHAGRELGTAPSVFSNETYPVRPDTVLPDEPGHLG
jgi:glycine/D-amino acid oxidase-like deaminating enzyme